MAINDAEYNRATLMFSTECSKELIKDKIFTLKEYLGNKLYMELYVDDTAKPSMEYISKQCCRMKIENNIKVVIIDYIQLVEEDKKIYTRLKELAEKLKITILVVYMMSGSNSTNEKPALEDIKNKELVEIADKVVLLHRIINDNNTTDKGLEVIIAKNS